ncbi:small ribosomal subunit biogenesis GTPase RsgA [Reinekea sp.]|jgi:ribosome biogenesis GTPase|uniref:small ribosomal subunit biogenesis GTPase RsgA n=1 Tax=Reinekea sp. TaxID=1970455 RepID=UPI0039896A5E
MSKRKLSRQQQFRIDKVQQERLARAERKHEKIEQTLASDNLSEALDGLVIAHFGATLDIEDAQGNITRCSVRSNLPVLVTGDEVIWHADEKGESQGVIVALKERKSILTRPDYRGKLRPVAANVDRIIIVACPSPRTPVNLIDRYLVATAHDDIQPVILLNKHDLIDQAPEMLTELSQYEALGCETLIASINSNEELQAIKTLVADGNSVFVGQSGVGKSSIIAALLPGEDIRIGEISEATGKGRHTTTTAKIYHIPSGGQLIDSPGIREFGLWHITEDDLDKGFPDVTDHAQYCKFNNCTHTHEPKCAVKLAVDEGQLLARRLNSYLSIRDSIDEVTMRS